MIVFPRRGSYTGRLAWDSQSGFHIDPKNRRVVTLDGGKTWRYAKRSDKSHRERYEKRLLEPLVSTDQQLKQWVWDHGAETAEQMMREQHPQHFDVKFGAHNTQTPTATSHTDATGE